MTAAMPFCGQKMKSKLRNSVEVQVPNGPGGKAGRLVGLFLQEMMWILGCPRKLVKG